MKMAKKTTMKLTPGILAVALTMTTGMALATNAAAQTDAIDNARSTAKSLQQKQANDSNAALDAAGVPAPSQPAAAKPASASAKPAPGAPAPAVKPAQIPGAKAAQAQAPAVKATPVAKAVSTSGHNQLQKVNVVKGADSVQIEITSSDAVTPKVEKLKSPDRIAVTFPETSVASAQNKIAVDADGVKGVRIGMDGKTPPTTSVVIDLEKSLTYELTGTAGKSILTLHAQGGTQTAAATAVKTAAPAAPKVVAKSAPTPTPVVAKTSAAKTPTPAPVVAKNAPTVQATAAKNTPPAAKMVPAVGKPQTTSVKAEAVKADPMAPKTAAKVDPKAQVQAAVAVKTMEATPALEMPTKVEEKKADKPEDKKWAMSGKRDPFFSPVVQQQGSGCSTGKKCLEIGNINVRGVVRSDNGFIAVVTNNLNKAYFLRENDPVFNGYVVKITGDSVTFQETIQDKLGKTSTREVTKRIVTPAV